MPEIDLPHGTITVHESGPADGEPVVFVHGLLVDSRLWRHVVGRLQETHRCIVPDLPLGSHRRAMRPDAEMTPRGIARLVADLLERMDLHGVTLVGNDTGGAICQLVAAHHPERLGRLVLTNCDAYENFLPPAFRPLQWIARVPGGLTAVMQATRLAAVRRSPLAYGLLTERPIDPDVLADWVRPFHADAGVRRDVTRFVRAIHPRDTLDAARRLRAFHRPALLAWGTGDRFFTQAFARRLQADLPDARLEPIEGAKTFVSEDRPERLAELIAEFVASTQAMAA
jgi:pimeloyl-ACP methyl ester carboxylesterase